MLSSQYFHNCWGVNYLQVKEKYNKVIKVLWKYCAIVSRNFFYLSILLCQNSLFHEQFSWVKFLYFFSSLCTILSKTHIVLHTHTHTQNNNNNNKNKNLGLKHFSSFMFGVVQNSFLNFKKSSNSPLIFWKKANMSYCYSLN